MPQTIKGRPLTTDDTNKMSPAQLKALEKRIDVERAALKRTSRGTSVLTDGIRELAKHVPFVGKPIAKFIGKESDSFVQGLEERDHNLSRTNIAIPYNYKPDYKGQSYSSNLLGIKPSRKK